MIRARARAAWLCLVMLALGGCGQGGRSGEELSPPSAFASGRFGDVDDRRLAAADAEPGNWFTNGRDSGGSYFSPLQQIDDRNVVRLGFAWDYALGTARAQEGTPIVVDGVMYLVGVWGRVYALDAETGRELWTYVPEVDGQYGRYACCDVPQRGISVWKGRVYAGSTDGYLQALDAKTGRLIWRTDTLPDGAREKRQPYTSSGSPQIAGNVVVIGSGGADFGVRGYVVALDLDTGKTRWRFYTVPRDPRTGPQEGPHLDAALKTWDPAGNWTRYGGGGTAWDALAYDPELDLLYVGTGNASPYNYRERSPKGGDNLYLSSILAIRPKTGALAWYFQQVPAEQWDFTATQKFILRDLKVDGRARKVLMHAPKNGFFYVLDRESGKLISAKPFVKVNWTKGLDANGRPIPSPEADWGAGTKLLFPSFAGGHNWPPMSASEQTGLVYVPANEAPRIYIPTSRVADGHRKSAFDIIGLPPEGYDPKALAAAYGPQPTLAELSRNAPGPARTFSVLRALDPLTGRIAWEAPSPGFNEGGVMSSAGNLVFQSNRDGILRIYAAESGKLLKKIATGTSLMAAPMTYAVKGVQYVAVQGGIGGGAFRFPADSAAYRYGNANRLLVFRLDGGKTPIPPEWTLPAITPAPARYVGTPTQIAAGRQLFGRTCALCHVFGRGLVPDLRRLTPEKHDAFDEIVLRGLFAPNGMGRFDDVLSAADARAIHAYLVDETNKAAAGEKKPGAGKTAPSRGPATL